MGGCVNGWLVRHDQNLFLRFEFFYRATKWLCREIKTISVDRCASTYKLLLTIKCLLTWPFINSCIWPDSIHGIATLKALLETQHMGGWVLFGLIPHRVNEKRKKKIIRWGVKWTTDRKGWGEKLNNEILQISRHGGIFQYTLFFVDKQ